MLIYVSVKQVYRPGHSLVFCFVDALGVHTLFLKDQLSKFDGPLSGPTKPKQIVSLNLCVDELVLRLADPADISSVAFARPQQFQRDRSRGARPPGVAEEIIQLKPAPIIAGQYIRRTAVALRAQERVPEKPRLRLQGVVVTCCLILA